MIAAGRPLAAAWVARGNLESVALRFGELLGAVSGAEVRGDVDVTGLACDLGRVSPGTVYLCMASRPSDIAAEGAAAANQGAVGLVVARFCDLEIPQGRVPSVAKAIGKLASRLAGDPSHRLRVIGITGTNGKTTTASLVRHILELAGIQCGLLGTVNRVVGGEVRGATLTTPEPITLHRLLGEMVSAGDRGCVMEVSSHALAQGRADAVRFEAAVFTNLSRDHLDFHGDMDRYFAAKRKLFSSSPRAAVLNLDDPYGRLLAHDRLLSGGPKVTTFSVRGDESADFRAAEIECGVDAVRFRCESPNRVVDVTLPLIGEFNVANALAALATTHALGIDLPHAAAALASAEPVPGRFEPVDAGQPFTVLVDYAHTPDSLDKALRSARQIARERVICVFGCGGDRDRGKRPRMGRIAARLADLSVVTSDNPRSEEPLAIIEEVVRGFGSSAWIEVEPDRELAIAQALSLARSGDLVLIAGRGHERTQARGDGWHPLDDREVASRFLASP
jgi:UDP-N-acetylmuramoyl-L-alanyl-D-glutamate--2,6-diaminopimelate ligase